MGIFYKFRLSNLFCLHTEMQNTWTQDRLSLVDTQILLNYITRLKKMILSLPAALQLLQQAHVPHYAICAPKSRKRAAGECTVKCGIFLTRQTYYLSSIKTFIKCKQEALPQTC